MTDEQIFSYLNEISDSLSGENGSAENIAYQHLKECNEMPVIEEDINLIEKPDTGIIYKNKQYTDEKIRERQIVTEAINQKYIELNSILEIDNKKILLAILVKGYYDCMAKHRDYIEHTFYKCFSRLIPSDLMKAWQKYKELIVPFPGFTYQCSKDFGEGKTYNVQLDLPMYFRPEICTELFKKTYSAKIPKLEKSIVYYYYHKNLKAETEVKYAKILAGIPTYYQLLKKKPFWYDMLITYLKKKNNWE